MLYLRTGLPGSFKTSTTISDLIELRKSDLDQAKRQVYYYNIDFNNLEHPLYSAVKDWVKIDRHDLENIWPLYDGTHPIIKQGSIIIVDECQDVYPMRSKGEVPNFIKFFEKHRHTGCDFYLITQQPRQIDIHVRSLVGDHLDHKRVLGRDLIRIKHLNRCMDGDDLNSPEIQSTTRKAPKQVYGLYKSAVIHTHKKKLPKKIIFGLPLLLLFIFLMIYWLITVLSGFGSEAKNNEPQTISTNSTNHTSKSKLASTTTDFDPNLSTSLFIVAEHTLYGTPDAIFEYVTSEKTLTLSLYELRLLAKQVEKISDFFWVVDGTLVTKKPRPAYDPRYVCCGENSDTQQQKRGENQRPTQMPFG